MTTTTTLKFGTDRNGNRILKISPKGERGFSVQTNGNLPKTHAMGDLEGANLFFALRELRAHLREHGTTRQNAICQKPWKG